MTLLDNAITRAYTKKLTSHSNTDDFKPYQAIRRDEAAKFFVDFAKLVGKTNYTTPTQQCQFSDLNEARPDLKEAVIESCKLGIFRGNKGTFSPSGILTNAQSVAVLMRIIDGYQSESWFSHRAERYYQRANTLALLDNLPLQNKEGLAERGNVVILLYNARKHSGTTSALTILNRNETLKDDDLNTSYHIQEIVKEEIKSLLSASLLSQEDLATFDGKIVLHYNQWCTTFWSGYTQVRSITYEDTTTTTLQSIDLHFSLCKDPQFKWMRTDSVYKYTKRLTLHELGHYFSYIKDVKFPTFEKICRTEGRNNCSPNNFISEYAQTDKYEDYAEHFAYRYLLTLQKETALWTPEDIDSKKIQTKMKYFDMTRGK